MPAYLAARVTVTDKEKYEHEFLPALMKAHEAYDVKIIGAAFDPEMLAGEYGPGTRITIIECQDEAHARALFNSPEAQQAMQSAHAYISDRHISIIPGFVPQPKRAEPVAAEAKEPAE